MRRVKPTLIATAAIWLTGCGTYDARFVYEPNPAEVALTHKQHNGEQPDEERVGRVLATIIGVRRDDAEIAFPNTVEVRMRIENETDQTVAIDPSTMQLLSADLKTFPAPVTRPEGTVTVEPAGESMISAYFSFPGEGYPGQVNMNALSLKWTMRVGERRVQRSIMFDQREYYYYDRHDRTGRYRYGLGLWRCY